MSKKILGIMLLIFTMIIVSCSKEEDFSNLNNGGSVIVDQNAGLVVRASSLRNQEILFRVFDASQNEVTDMATFYVNDASIEGNSFSSSEIGDFTVYATYTENGNTIQTEASSFNVIIPKRKIVIEDYTGAWCGYCPRIKASIDAVHLATEHIAVVAIHNDDDMALPFEEDLRDEFGVFGFPSGRINRTQNWANPHPAEDVINIAGLDTNTALSINSQLFGNQLVVQVKVVSEQDLTNTKLVVYLVEDGILSNQVNYFDQDPGSPFYGLGNPIVDFVNDDVLRVSLTGILGDAIPSTSALQEYTANYDIDLNSSFNKNNLRLVAMLVQEDNTALNAQTATIDSVKNYE